MPLRSVLILSGVLLAATAIADSQLAVSAPATIPNPPSCTVSPSARGDRAVYPIADLGKVSEWDYRPGQNHAVTFEADGSAASWDFATGRRIGSLYAAQEGQSAAILAMSENGRFAVLSSAAGTTHLWNIETGERLAELVFPPLKGRIGVDRRLYDVKFSTDGNRLAVRTMDGGVQLFETGTGRKIAEHHFIESIAAVRFSQDGHRLFATVSDGNITVAGEEGGLAVLDAMTGGVILSFFDARPNVRRQRWEINRDGTRLLETQTLRLLVDAQTGTALARSPAAYQQDAWPARFTRDGAFVVASEAKTRVIDVKDGRVLAEFEDLDIQPQYYVLDFDLHFSPDDKTVVARKQDDTATLVRLSDGSTLAALGRFDDGTNYRPYVGEPQPEDNFHTPYPSGEFSFSKDGSRLITRDRTNAVSLWDTRSGKRIGELGNVGKSGKYVQSPSSAWLVTLPEKGSPKLWDLSTGRRLAKLGKFDPQEITVAFQDRRTDEFVSPNEYGEQIVLFGVLPYSKERMALTTPETRLIIKDEKATAVWDIARARLLARFEPTFEESISIVWMSMKDHVYIVRYPTVLNRSGTQETHGELWDLSRGRRIADLSGELAYYAREGDRLWLEDDNGRDGQFALWEVTTGERLLTCDKKSVIPSFLQISSGARLLMFDKTSGTTLWRIGPH